MIKFCFCSQRSVSVASHRHKQNTDLSCSTVFPAVYQYITRTKLFFNCCPRNYFLKCFHCFHRNYSSKSNSISFTIVKVTTAATKNYSSNITAFIKIRSWPLLLPKLFTTFTAATKLCHCIILVTRRLILFYMTHMNYFYDTHEILLFANEQ